MLLLLPTLTTSDPDDVMHFVLLFLSIVIVVISANGFRRRRNSRYFFLMLAFVFFAADQGVTFYQEIYLNGLLISIPFLSLHLVHFLEFLMSVSILTALLLPILDGPEGPAKSEF
jgi:hypothetical protein